MGALAGGAAATGGSGLKGLGKGGGNDGEDREGGGEFFCQLSEGVIHLPCE